MSSEQIVSCLWWSNWEEGEMAYAVEIDFADGSKKFLIEHHNSEGWEETDKDFLQEFEQVTTPDEIWNEAIEAGARDEERPRLTRCLAPMKYLKSLIKTTNDEDDDEENTTVLLPYLDRILNYHYSKTSVRILKRNHPKFGDMYRMKVVLDQDLPEQLQAWYCDLVSSDRIFIPVTNFARHSKEGIYSEWSEISTSEAKQIAEKFLEQFTISCKTDLKVDNLYYLQSSEGRGTRRNDRDGLLICRHAYQQFVKEYNNSTAIS